MRLTQHLPKELWHNGRGTKSIGQNLQQKCNFKVGKHTRQLKIIISRTGRRQDVFLKGVQNWRIEAQARGHQGETLVNVTNIVTRSNSRKEKQTCESKGPSSKLQDPRDGEVGDLIIKSSKKVGVLQHSEDYFNHVTDANKHKNVANEEANALRKIKNGTNWEV